MSATRGSFRARGSGRRAAGFVRSTPFFARKEKKARTVPRYELMVTGERGRPRALCFVASVCAKETRSSSRTARGSRTPRRPQVSEERREVVPGVPRRGLGVPAGAEVLEEGLEGEAEGIGRAAATGPAGAHAGAPREGPRSRRACSARSSRARRGRGAPGCGGCRRCP